MKLVTLVEARKILPIDAKDLEIQLKYKIMRFFRDTDDDAAFYANELNKILLDCVVRDDEGNLKQDGDNNIYIKDDKRKEFEQRVSALQQTDTRSCDFYLSLKDIEALNLSVREMLLLNEFIKE